MEIYSIKIKSKTNPNIFIARTDDGEYILHSDIIVSRGINKGDIDSTILLEAVRESEVLIGTALSMKYLGSRLKTEKGVRDYLYKHGFTTTSINSIIDKLLSYKAIDDRTYAEAYIRSNPKFSKNKLKDKLRAAGVSKDIIESLIEDIDDTVGCEANANKYLRGKTLDSETKAKLYRRLVCMGYSYDTINAVMNKLKDEEQW